MKPKQIVFCFAGIVAFSFLLNFLWESLHGYSLYIDHIVDSDKYVPMMVYMSFMDALTILAMYLFTAFLYKNALWLKPMSGIRLFVFFMIGLVMGALAEYRAVYVIHEWHYNSRMPVLFGIGLSPLLQLSVTGLLAVLITARVSRDC